MHRLITMAAGAMMFGISSAAWAQRLTDSAATLNAEATRAYQRKDYQRFLALERGALELAPANARLIYNVACGEALAGHAGEAVRLLDTLRVRGLDLGAERDADFARIHGTAEWKAFLTRLAALRTPVVRSAVAFTLPDSSLMATGLAVDPRTDDAYVASTRLRKIVRRTRAGTISDFTREAQDGFLAGAALAIDTARRLLYATTSTAPYMVGHRAADDGRSGVFAFDLATGRTMRKVMLAADGKRHFLNALVVDRQGTVYISDTGLSGIYRLAPGADSLAVFVPSTTFEATQGLALSEDERTLYVADYVDGLWALDLATRARRYLEAPAASWLAGLDGLSRVPGGFVAVQIGVTPERVVRLHLSDDGGRVADVQVLESARTDYAGPIQGTVADGAFLYVANSQLGLADAARLRPTVVLRMPIESNRK